MSNESRTLTIKNNQVVIGRYTVTGDMSTFKQDWADMIAHRKSKGYCLDEYDLIEEMETKGYVFDSNNFDPIEVEI